MMTIDTMIYIILFISGVTIVSLYLNIYSAIKLHNIIDQSDKLEKANDTIENLHLEKMRLIEQVDELETESYKGNLQVRPSIQTRNYYENRTESYDRLEEMIRHHDKTKKDNIMEVQYISNIKYKDEEFKLTGTNKEK